MIHREIDKLSEGSCSVEELLLGDRLIEEKTPDNVRSINIYLIHVIGSTAL